MAYTLYRCEYEGCDFVSYNKRAYEEHLKEHKKKMKEALETSSGKSDKPFSEAIQGEKKEGKKKKKKEVLDSVIKEDWRGLKVTIFTSAGNSFRGKVLFVSKYEIAIEDESGRELVIFKHDISYVVPDGSPVKELVKRLGLKEV